MKNMVFKGTVIKNGEGTGIVVETGNSTHLGRMLLLLMNASSNKHSLGNRLEKKLSGMMFVSILISIVLFLSLNARKLIDAYNGLYLSLFLTQAIPVSIITIGFVFILKTSASK